MRELSSYLRPKNDNGLGIHDSASCYARPSGDLNEWARDLYAKGYRWYKLLVSGSNKVDIAEALVNAGIVVVARFYIAGPHPNFVINNEEARPYYNVGVRIYEWGNEPNINGGEWEGEHIWDAAVDRVMEQWGRNIGSLHVLGSDVQVLYPALTPGGEYPHADFFKTSLEWLRINNHLDWLEEGVGIHNRPLNHPLDYPYDSINQQGIPLITEAEAESLDMTPTVRADMNWKRANHMNPGATLDQDSVCFLMYEFYDDLIKKYLGYSVPLYGTEAGPELTQEDDRYLRLDPQRHSDMVRDIATNYRTGRWRDCLFSQMFWLYDNMGHYDFSWSSWIKNVTNYGNDLPAVQDLPTFSNYVRPFGMPISDIPPMIDIFGLRIFDMRDELQGGYMRAMSNRQYIAIHHSGAPAANEPVYETARGTARYHVQSNGWPGIGYHMLVGYRGDIALCGDLDVARAHVYNMNHTAIGIEFPGNFVTGSPTASQLAMGIELIRSLKSIYPNCEVKGHKEMPLQSTACPGDLMIILRTYLEVPAMNISVVRNAAWNVVGVPLNTDSAFYNHAKAGNLGRPVTAEGRLTTPEGVIAYQGYEKKILAAFEGDWANLVEIDWL